MTKDEVLKWLDEQDKPTLTELADYFIDRDFAAHPDDVDIESLPSNDEIDSEMLEDAAARLRRGDFREALHVLTLALGPDFDRLDSLSLTGSQS